MGQLMKLIKVEGENVLVVDTAVYFGSILIMALIAGGIMWGINIGEKRGYDQGMSDGANRCEEIFNPWIKKQKKGKKQ